MGSSLSHAAAPAPPVDPPLGLLRPDQFDANENVTKPEIKSQEKVDSLNLPVPYRQLQREAYIVLHPQPFEGIRFDIMQGLTKNFSLSHSVFTNRMQFPRSTGPIKIPPVHHELEANFIRPKFTLFMRILTGGGLNAMANIDLTDNLNMIAQFYSPYSSHGAFSCEYKGKDYRTQFQMASHGSFNLNCIKSVTPNLSLGTDVFWLSRHREYGIGFAARYNTDKMVAAGQVAGTGVVVLSLVHKVSEI